jgi:hypothetical protein
MSTTRTFKRPAGWLPYMKKTGFIPAVQRGKTGDLFSFQGAWGIKNLSRHHMPTFCYNSMFFIHLVGSFD